MEAIIPTEIGMPTLRTRVTEQLSTESIVKDLDMADELLETAAVRIISYHRQLANLYNKHVKPQVLQPGNLILERSSRTQLIQRQESFSPTGKVHIL